MLNHLKRKLTKRAARGKARAASFQTRCLVERLEERTMLSITPTGPPPVYALEFAPPPAGHEQRFTEGPPAFMWSPSSSKSYEVTYYEFESVSSMQAFGPPDRGFQDHLFIERDVAPPTQIESDWDPGQPVFGAGQIGATFPKDAMAGRAADPSHASQSSFRLATVDPATNYGIYGDRDFYDDHGPPLVSGGSSPNASIVRIVQNGSNDNNGGYSGVKPTPPSTNTNSVPQTLDPGLRPNLWNVYVYRASLYNSLVNAASQTSDALAESQLSSRDTNASAVLNAVARDIAFQEFLPTLFQSNSSPIDEHANVNVIGQDRVQPEVADGLIHPTDSSTINASHESSDAVTRERENTNEVLDELEDVDRLMPAAASQDVAADPDSADTALADSLTGEVDGGMVLLRATRDANVSGFDLTPVYAEHVGRFNLSTKMDTSVGMFQAMDVASDDAPLIDVIQPTESSAQVNRDSQSEDKLPTKHEQSSASKAATLVGVTTLTGALVWMNRAVSAKPTAQKRRASQG